MKYSQNDEQDVILHHFGDSTGTLIDIGANDGITFSNSRALIERGWNALLVEPSPRAYARLLENIKDNAALALRVAVGMVNNRVVLHEGSDTCVSSTVAAEMDRWPMTSYTPTTVEQITPGTLLSRAERMGLQLDDVRFITIDAEGVSADIALALPWKRLPAVELLCVEHENQTGQLLKRLRTAGFRAKTANSENLILERTV